MVSNRRLVHGSLALVPFFCPLGFVTVVLIRLSFCSTMGVTPSSYSSMLMILLLLAMMIVFFRVLLILLVVGLTSKTWVLFIIFLGYR